MSIKVRVVSSFLLIFPISMILLVGCTSGNPKQRIKPLMQPAVPSATGGGFFRYLSYRKHFGPDHIGVLPFPAEVYASRYSWPQLPPRLTIPYPNSSPKEYWTNSHPSQGWTFVHSGERRRVQFVLLSLGQADVPGTGREVSKTYQIWYRHSFDSGQTFTGFRPLIQSGSEYSPFHPIRGVYVGINSYGFAGNTLIEEARNGDILLPIYSWPLEPGTRRAYNPRHRVTSYSVAMVARGKWNEQSKEYGWEISDPTSLPDTLSTRGVDESAVQELNSRGKCFLIGRGSNQGARLGRTIPGHYWVFRSEDGCKTWVGRPKPLALDGQPFFAPAAPPLLVRSKATNDVFFLGAYSRSNPTGNLPRDRVIVSKVNLQTLSLIKDSTQIVDQRDEFDGEYVDLICCNNYYRQPDGSLFLYNRRNHSRTPAESPLNWMLLKFGVVTPSVQNLRVSVENGVPTLSWNLEKPDQNVEKTLVLVRGLHTDGLWEIDSENTGVTQSVPLARLPLNQEVEIKLQSISPNGTIRMSPSITYTATPRSNP